MRQPPPWISPILDAPSGPAHVLIADDDPRCLDLMTRLMRRLGHQVTRVADGEQALDAVERHAPDLILLDVDMPRMNGLDVCHRLKSDPATRLIPVVLVTGASAADDRVRGILAGADDFLAKPFHPEELVARAASLLRLKRYTDELESAESVILSLALTVEARDPYTKGHCERLAQYATTLGEAIGLRGDALSTLYRGAYLHDLGKIGIPDHVLLKPEPLSPEERVVMEQHPVIGEQLCSSLKSLQRVRPIIRSHHERMDGSGYPDGLRGDEIPLLVQIVSVVDTFDAMTTNRPYRQAWPSAAAFEELRREADRGRLPRLLVEQFVPLARG